ncbi:MAG: hypothetical protein F4Z35_08440, partial [Dehalococcoidia bacterium]|nr:hypothetical protein [Dehalococcoidia bacterium]
EPTQEPTAAPTPEPTAVPKPTPTEVPPTPVIVVPTATPEPTPEPVDTSAPYIIVVDFYAGNTFNDPGPENCDPTRCGGALIQFSEAVLVHGNPVMDVLGKGLMRCVEGCSDEEPSSYIVLTGQAWVEAGDIVIDSEIVLDGGGRIADVAGNEIESYKLGGVIAARVSDFAMVQGPTPVPTPVPDPRDFESPHVHRLKYVDTTLELHLSEPVTTYYRNIADIGVVVRHADGETERGTCMEPCSGDTALLTFSVPGMKPSSIAARFELLKGAEIYDGEEQHIIEDFDHVVALQASVIEGIRVLPVDPNGQLWPYTEIHVYLTNPVWINATEMYLEFNTGARMPFFGQYSPKYLGTLLIFAYPLETPEEDIPKMYEGDILERFVTDGWMVGEDGLAVQDITFDPITLTR